jgi:putative flippase GtrA
MTSLPGRLLASPSARQLARFLIVGCLNVAVTFVVFLFCYRTFELGSLLLATSGAAGEWLAEALRNLGVGSIDAAAANFVGYLAGMVNSFVLNKAWTFEARGRTWQQMQRFVTLNVVGLVGSTVIMFVGVDLLGAPYLPVFAGTVVLTTIFHFLGNKHWTFAGRGTDGIAGLGGRRR